MSTCGPYGSGPQIHISSSFLFLVSQTFLIASWQPQLITSWHVLLNMFRTSSNFSSRAANAVLPVNVLPSLMTALGPLWGPLFLFLSLSVFLPVYLFPLISSWSLNPPVYRFVLVLPFSLILILHSMIIQRLSS